MLLCFSAQQELLPTSQIPSTRCFGFLLEAQMGLFKKEKGKGEKKLQCETQLLPGWRGSAKLCCFAQLDTSRNAVLASAGKC